MALAPRRGLGIGVIGYGYWGPNLVRNFSEIPGAGVVAVADLNGRRLAQVRQRYPEVFVTDDVDAMLARQDVDAVVVATPISTHFQLGMSALSADKHVLIEKPITASAHEARLLIAEAARRRRVLMVDHTFLYTGAVRRILEMHRSGVLGRIQYYDSVRVNLGLIQSDVSVIWDLAVHDLSIVDALMPRPLAVMAHGMSHVPGHPENIAYLTVLFPGNQLAHLHVNWLAPVKVRRTLIGCQDKMVVYDDVEPSEKVKIYDCGASLSPAPASCDRPLVSYRNGDVWAPRIDTTEGLRTEALHFVECIARGQSPLTDGHAGLRVVEVLEAASQSMREGGRMIELPRAEEADLRIV
ncbi:MAG TPA: Gfo/Idh/MocA family oxidoreductase [Candidatus Dormibacteraeota bacterium]